MLERSNSNVVAASRYPKRPILLGAERAHAEGLVTYSDDGSVTIHCEELAALTGRSSDVVPACRQYPTIRPTFDDLNKAISSLSNSPRLPDGRTLREAYDQELERYERLVAQAHAAGRWEPDYGTYVYDHVGGDLYLVAPERWHRLALVTSNSKLLTDPQRALSWSQIRERLEGAVVGFAGVSVGSNVIEGWLREARPRRIKVADPDWVELTNLNRCERMSMQHIVANRAERFDRRMPYGAPRVSKAECVAHQAQLVDPYLEVDVYGDGLGRENVEHFLLGDGGGEPRLDVLVEEMDNFDMKVLVRQAARRHGVDVVMLSDFGHRAHLLWNPFRTDPGGPLGAGGPDERLFAALAATKGGDRTSVSPFVAALCGDDFASDEFALWLDGEGEQPTSSAPQSGATAMASGAIGGKEIALRVLGHAPPPGNRAFYDLRHRRVEVG